MCGARLLQLRLVRRNVRCSLMLTVVFSRDSARVQSRRICRWSKAASSTTQWFIEKDEVFNCPEDWLIVFIDPHGMRLLYSFNINAATILEWTICHKFHKFSSCKIQCHVSYLSNSTVIPRFVRTSNSALSISAQQQILTIPLFVRTPFSVSAHSQNSVACVFARYF